MYAATTVLPNRNAAVCPVPVRATPLLLRHTDQLLGAAAQLQGSAWKETKRGMWFLGRKLIELEPSALILPQKSPLS